MQSKFLLTVIGGLFASSAVLAQTGVAPAPPVPAAAPSAAAGSPGTDRAARIPERFARFFVQLDQNGDGTISREEAARNPRLAKDFDAIDSNKDGKLDKDELRAQEPALHPRSERHARDGRRSERFDAAFKAADLDRNGALTKAEVETAAGKWFDKMDANQDGKLTRDELRAQWQAHGGPYAKHSKRAAKFDTAFKAADANGDGALAKTEAETGKLDWIVKNFDAIDANKDGKATREEIRAFMMSRHKRS